MTCITSLLLLNEANGLLQTVHEFLKIFFVQKDFVFFETYLRVISFTHYYFLAFGNGKKHFILSVFLNIQIIDALTCFDGLGKYNLFVVHIQPTFLF